MNEKTCEQVNAKQEKSWDELTPDEKIERTRQQVKYLLNEVGELSSKVRQIENVLLNHYHLDSKVVSKAQISYGRDIIGRISANKEKVYF